MFSWGPAITLHIIQWDLEPTRSWAVYAIKKLLSPKSSQCGDKILSSQLVYCSRLGHRSQIIQGHAKTIHVPLNLEKAFFTTSGFNQFVVNSECQTHFLGPLKYTALTWGCSCNPNTGIQRVLLPLDGDCAENENLVTMLFWIQLLFPVEKASGWIITSNRAIHSLVICVVPGQTLARTQSSCVGEEIHAKCYRSLCKASLLHEAGSFPSPPLHFAFSAPTTFLCQQPVAAVILPIWECAERNLVHLNVCNHSSCFCSIYSVKQCLYLQYLSFI